MAKVFFNTCGDGYWSNVKQQVEVTDMKLGYISDELDFGELCVYFNTTDSRYGWQVDEKGLIYTDSQFEEELQEFLNKHGLAGNDVSYSEQGMQGDDYVSLDVGKKFLNSWAKKFNVDLKAMLEQQEAAFQARWGLTA